MTLRFWRNLSLKEKSIFLMLFAVLLPTLVLFYGQYRALTELRDKSKVSYANDLRLKFFEIQDKTHVRLLEAARLTLQDFPDSVAQSWDDKQVERNLSALLDKNAGAESAFLYAAGDKFNTAVYYRDKGFLQAKETNSPGDFFSRFNTSEENFALPINDAVFSAGEQGVEKFLVVQRRCQRCQQSGLPPDEVVFLFRVLSDTKDLTKLRFVEIGRAHV